MFRFRRYRVFLIVAVFVILVVYHFTTVQEWEEAKDAGLQRLKDFSGGKQQPLPSAPKPTKLAEPEVTPEPAAGKDSPSKDEEKLKVTTTTSSSSTSRPVTTKPWSEQARPSAGPEPEEKYEKFGMGGKSRNEGFPDLTNKPAIHWERLPDNFAVPDEMVIQLPKEKPRSIPKIQYSFKSESALAKADREKKAARIKEAAKHTWDGYREKAWLHDEVSPVSGDFRDPFNGWAATLVDGLDTLYIMGMEEEFLEAVESVGTIDFTTSTRKDIPVFETNIRYLGGLISAYDVSGHKHKILLDKAKQLADVLMGAFDTPNRMPITYYYWRPTFAKNPHRAGTRVVMSEIGTLSLEFTRLAQITGNHRYYDAVARITDEFEQWQNETKLPGLWPLVVDASGCSKPPPPDIESLSGFGEQSPLLDNPALSTVAHNEPTDMEKEAERIKQALEAANVGIDTRPDSEKEKDKRSLRKRQMEISDKEEDDELESDNLLETNPSPERVDCVPQGLTSPPYSDMEEFSFGGRGDSTYEYFPKMYLLLGGVVSKYQEMYEKSVAAANKHLMFRPMVPQNLDLRVVGTANAYKDSTGKITSTLKPEFTHLSCFTGGMWGIGGKIFQRDADLRDAVKLTNACYWAYQQTATGIMPDTFDVIPCDDMEKCQWNKTQWYNDLDPWREYREAGERLYQEASKLSESQENQAAAALAASAEDAKNNPSNVPPTGIDTSEVKEPQEEGNKPDTEAKSEGLSSSSEELPSELSPPKKREVEDLGDDAPTSDPEPSLTEQASTDLYSSPTHEEFVENRMAMEHIPEGIPTASNRDYLLRPEAIESVFIMYRITGDETWREKGWKMFEAIDHWCRADFGYSSLHDTTDPNAYQMDGMESFWMAETLKYFYLLFSPPDRISLDEYVFNTEAHPFKRPR